VYVGYVYKSEPPTEKFRRQYRVLLLLSAYYNVINMTEVCSVGMVTSPSPRPGNSAANIVRTTIVLSLIDTWHVSSHLFSIASVCRLHSGAHLNVQEQGKTSSNGHSGCKPDIRDLNQTIRRDHFVPVVLTNYIYICATDNVSSP
jgi:hypothetical protein